MLFYNRENELKDLINNINDAEHGFVFKVYVGLRRVGKTTLILKGIQESKKKFLYLLVNQNETELILVENFKIKIKEQLSLNIKAHNLKGLFEELFQYGEKNYYILIIDEFQNFTYVNNAIYWYLLELIDSYELGLNPHKLKFGFIVLGSYIRLMEQIFSYDGPLYKRQNRGINIIKPLSFKYIKLLCENYGLSLNETIQLYGLIGGYPYYYKFVFENNLHTKSIKEIFKSIFIDDLFIEIKQMIEVELHGDKYQYSILEAIAKGNHTKKDIVLFVFGLNSKNVGYRNKYNEIEKYIHLLEDLGLLIKKIKVPNGETGKYFIYSPIIKIFFKYVKPYISFLEEQSYDYILNNFIVNFEKDLGFVYEEIIKDYLQHGNYGGLTFSQIGKRWKGKNFEIDIIGVNELENYLLAVECKYQSKIIGVNILKQLQNKIKYIQWNQKNEKSKILSLVVSHSNFTKEAINFAKINKIDLLQSKFLNFNK